MFRARTLAALPSLSASVSNFPATPSFEQRLTPEGSATQLYAVATTTASTPARYGVDAASDPNEKIISCWMSEPPLLPSGLPMTSMAAATR